MRFLDMLAVGGEQLQTWAVARSTIEDRMWKGNREAVAVIVV
jgi:hypothetical protein